MHVHFLNMVFNTYLSATGSPAPVLSKSIDALQDNELFDAENSEPLTSGEGCSSSSQDWPPTSRVSEVNAAASSPKRQQSNSSTQRQRARGTDALLLYGVIIFFCPLDQHLLLRLRMANTVA